MIRSFANQHVPSVEAYVKIGDLPPNKAPCSQTATGVRHFGNMWWISNVAWVCGIGGDSSGGQCNCRL